MKHKLDILIPCYNEGQETIKTLLDSIAIQRSVNMDEVGVIICCDGGKTTLSKEFIARYPFSIEFYMCEHKGVSATRNACLDHSTADYVMWCDCDDCFMNVCGLYVIFREMVGEGFDHLVSAFVEETKHPQTGEMVYVNHPIDSTFVHGKVSRRQYLIDKNIRWNDNLLIHEDSFFQCLCQKLSKNVKYCPQPFYMWCWNDNSVCRHDPKYILKTYWRMLESNTALVNQFLERDMKDEAMFYATSMIMDAYYSFNCSEWTDINNKEYRDMTERRFKKYWGDFKDLYEAIALPIKTQITAGIRQRFFAQGLLLESVTFADWIKHIEEM